MRLGYIFWLAIALLVLVAHSEEDHESDDQANYGDEEPPEIDGLEVEGIGEEDPDEEPDTGDDFDPELALEGEEGGEGEEEELLSSDQLKNLHGKVDANADGKLSLTELLDFGKVTRKAMAKKEAESLIEEMDSNKDGKVSLEEHLNSTFSAPPLQTMEEGESEEGTPSTVQTHVDPEKEAAAKEVEKQKFKLADANGDGFLDPDELPSLVSPETHDGVFHFTVVELVKEKDKDKDGVLDFKEFWDYGGEPEEEDEEAKAEQQADFDKLDKDNNRKLDVEEVKQWESGDHFAYDAMDQLLGFADLDGDMHVNLTELDQARASLGDSTAHPFLREWAEHHEL